MRLIHYSKNPIGCLENREYSQKDLNWQAKPNGLWLSVEGCKGTNNYNWKQWCESEGFNLSCLAICYEVILHENANIIHLKSAKEIFEFSKFYPLKTRHWDAEWDTYQLQWDEVKEKHQGIIIAPYQWECRLALETCWYYGWDCASGCIWDINCIKEFKMLDDAYLKSGCYTCEMCKEFFTAHNRIFLCEKKRYACPYCKSTQYVEEEYNVSS